MKKTIFLMFSFLFFISSCFAIEITSKKNSVINATNYNITNGAGTTVSDARDDIGLSLIVLNNSLANKYGLSYKDKGLIVNNVITGSAIFASGIRVGDLILKVNGNRVVSIKDYANITSKIKDEDTILFYIKRNRSSFFVGVKFKK